MSNFVKTKIIALIVFSFFLLPLAISADTQGQGLNFSIDQDYDLEKREKVSATLQKISQNLYFYIDNDWWNSLDYIQRNEIDSVLNNLAAEFDYKIYPILTSTFGQEWKPGIDKDERITILLHPMIAEAGGYFNTGDGYLKLQNPKSNEREMVYLNAKHIDKPLAKGFLAHEFMHLITFNQKNIIRKVSEETWLNEARADYTSTLLGYDEVYENSNLQRRVRNFLEKPNDSLTEWLNQRADYGAVNLFTQYLVDHYGIKILIDSLQSSSIGIPSLNEALAKNGFKEDFSQVFTDWTIAVLVNDCKFGQTYCYLNPNLKNLKVFPLINFLPLIGESKLSITHRTFNWASNWQKITGGKGTLTLKFDGSNEVIFKVPYLVCDYQSNCTLQFLNLDRDQNGQIVLPEFNIKYSSLTIIPSIQSKFSGFDGTETSYIFSWETSIVEKTQEERDAELRKQLLTQISVLQKEIARIQALLFQTEIPAGFVFKKNLSSGMTDPDVVCLKIILEKEGCLTGVKNTDYFAAKTLAGVKCFCQKYKEDISNFAGSNVSCGGFVGKGIRAKLNQLISK